MLAVPNRRGGRASSLRNSIFAVPIRTVTRNLSQPLSEERPEGVERAGRAQRAFPVSACCVSAAEPLGRDADAE